LEDEMALSSSTKANPGAFWTRHRGKEVRLGLKPKPEGSATGHSLSQCRDNSQQPVPTPTWRELEAAEVRRADDVIAALARLWPKTFFVEPDRRLLLVIGIGDKLREIMLPAIAAGRSSSLDIFIALRRYVNSARYLEACLFNAPRIDLSGEAAGRVSYRQSLYAIERLRVGR
jgi:hypothetical protein